MSISGKPEPIADASVAALAKPASVALVPLAPASERSNGHLWRWSPEATFVAHLMACARQVPQTRRIRRATAADAQNAYRTRQTPATKTGDRTLQVV